MREKESKWMEGVKILFRRSKNRIRFPSETARGGGVDLFFSRVYDKDSDGDEKKR